MMVISLEDTEAYRRYLQLDDPRHGWHLDFFRLRPFHPARELEDLGTQNCMT